MADSARRRDVVCQELVTRAGHPLRATLAGVVNFFNPWLIVIGGGVANADQLLAAVRGTKYRRSLPIATRDLLILPSALGSVTGIIGAAIMVADELFSPRHVAATLARHAASGTLRPREIASIGAASR